MATWFSCVSHLEAYAGKPAHYILCLQVGGTARQFAFMKGVPCPRERASEESLPQMIQPNLKKPEGWGLRCLQNGLSIQRRSFDPRGKCNDRLCVHQKSPREGRICGPCTETVWLQCHWAREVIVKHVDQVVDANVSMMLLHMR